MSSEQESGDFDSYDFIGSDFTAQKDKLEKQITGVELKQQEIQKHIADIDSNIQFLQQYLQTQKDQEKQRVIRGAVAKNIELIAKLYSVNREYEDVKVKYFRDISDNIYKMHHLISVEIRRIDEKVDKIDDGDFVGVMKQVMDLISHERGLHDGKIPLSENVQKEMEQEDEAYKL